MMKTEEDRQAHELRHRAHPISAAGKQVEAHRLFVEAASRYSEDDRSAGAAACWYDLAESFSRLPDQRDRENLQEAERLLRLCLKSPARKRDPLRLARTHDALGRILRKQTRLVVDAELHLQLEDQSIAEHQRAVKILAQLPMLDQIVGSGYRANLGNALARRGHNAEAIRCYERAIADLEWAHANLPRELFVFAASDRPPLPSARLHFAELLARISQAEDTDTHVDRIATLARQARAEGDRHIATRAAQVELFALSQHRPSERARIEACIREVDPRQLGLDEQANYIRGLIACEHLDVALSVTREGAHQALLVRQRTLADHAADEAAELAQEFGVLEAQIHIRRSQPIDAFLSIENVSALRYFDSVKVWGWSHRDPIARALRERCVELSSVAGQVDSLAAFVPSLPPEAQLEAFERLERDLQQAQDAAPSTEHAQAAMAWLLETLRSAPSKSSAAAYLREQAQQLFDEIRRLGAAASAREPEHARETLSCDSHLLAAELAELLRKHPNTVMLRLHWSRDLLAAAVWLDQDELVGKAARIPLHPDALRPAMRQARFRADRPSSERPAPKLAEVLESLDLGAVLPPASQTRGAELILLPSTYASLIPWAAAGPPGQTLLDSFESIVWLPNLTPLRMRQVNRRERSGGLIVCPGKAQKKPTSMHGKAFPLRRPDERVLFEAAATVANTRAAARMADVVSFYAHGSYERMRSGHIRLADGKLEVGTLAADFAGCERVELWACRSGVNLSTSVLTPLLVDEAFGIDIAFHHAGARSTIGTLSTVIEAVTAKICARYRSELAAAHRAPAALARAQRWWRDEALPEVLRLLHTESLDDAWQAIAKLLDVESEQLAEDVLGQTLSAQKHTPGNLWAALSPPDAWAGYRFVGVCERRPEGELLPETVELTPAEHGEFMAILTEAQAGVHPRDPDEILHDELHSHYARLTQLSSPTHEQAVAVARLYADQREGRRSHHLHRALAWLHEANAGAINGRQRAELDLEAAYLWLELARAELQDERLRFVATPEPGHLARLERLAPGTADAELFQAWLWRLQSPPPPGLGENPGFTEALLEHFQAAWAAARRHPVLSYVGIRARAAAVDLLLAIAVAPQQIVVEAANEYDDIEELTPETRRICMHMQASIAELVARHDRFDYPEPDFRWLGHRDFPLLHRRVHQATAANPGPDQVRALRVFESELISRLEGDFWAYPSKPAGFWHTTGSPGRPWYRILGSYNAAHLRGREQDQATVHFLATLHMGCDLRLGPLAAFARTFAVARIRHDGELPNLPWNCIWWRAHLLTLFEECSRLCWDAKDPFRDSVAELLEFNPDDPSELIYWEFGSCVRAMLSGPPSRTAAFEAERLLCSLDMQAAHNMPEAIEKIHAQFGLNLPERLRAPDPIQAMIRAQLPMNRLEAVERSILELPRGTGVIGLSSGLSELSLGISWRDGERLCSRSLVVDGLGLQLRARMGELLRYVSSDYEATMGAPPGRAEAWAQIQSLVDPHLAELLADVPVGTALSVLAPGFLRPLPVAGLTRAGRPLRDDFVIALLPHLGFGESNRLPAAISGTPTTVCVLGEEHEWGETRFGEAAIRTLRACYPVCAVAEPSGPITSPTIHEVDVIQAKMAEFDVLRLYGSPNAADLGHSTAALGLRGNRKLRAFNLSSVHFAKCECVELWGATSITGQSRMVANADHDRVPGLAWSFLASGAAGVVDLAWPVHDLVVALVCERFGNLRRAEPQPGSVALTHALQEVDALMQKWAHDHDGNASVHDALAWLDRAREVHLAQLGHDPRRVVPFAPHAAVPSVALGSARALIECCRRPEQLASVRWWGCPSPGLL